MDYAKEYPIAMKAITGWIREGLLKRKFHIVNGLDAAPSALPLLYSGGNTGKLCVLLFTLAELISYLTFSGSLRFPTTKPRLSSKPCGCMHIIIRLLILVVLVCGSAFVLVFACKTYLSFATRSERD